jgi:mRNA interferase RelE/StbE
MSSLTCNIVLCDFWLVKEIEFSPSPSVNGANLPPLRASKSISNCEQIDLKLKVFAETGVGDVKALKGVAGMRLRAGDWRVLFTMKANTITIHAVGHRRDIYD